MVELALEVEQSCTGTEMFGRGRRTGRICCLDFLPLSRRVEKGWFSLVGEEV